MLSKDLHKVVLIKILKAIYAEPTLRSILGFKGGTAAFMFYGLPRFSVDLDFDLLQPDKKDEVFTKIKSLLLPFGKLDEATEKHYTLFYLVNYQKGERNLKVEISKRPTESAFEVKDYLGISVLVMKQEDMLVSKLQALLTRKNFAARDLFDFWYFLHNNWTLNPELVEKKTGMPADEALEKAIEIVRKVKKTQLLQGLGDLLDEKQRVWAREKLQGELLFSLRLYQSMQKGK